ncbi:MAG: CRISPR-associated endonuclease Cas2 [Muribaculaceae bacterium]|nr:CRISPR-associated endonuclease Cas2 [Muribaculaceae bacterium]
MNILITYDIETIEPEGQKRLRKVAKVCLNFGQRVQNSVFECNLSYVEFIKLKHQLECLIDPVVDGIRIYHLSKDIMKSVETMGKDASYNPEDPMII